MFARYWLEYDLKHKLHTRNVIQFCCIFLKPTNPYVMERLQDFREERERGERWREGGGTDRNIILFVTARTVL